MDNELTKEEAYKCLQKFFDQKPFVLFGTGTSCAVDHRFGMEELQRYLNECMIKCELSTEQKREWDLVNVDLKNRLDFESAMGEIQDKEFLKIVTDCAAELVSRLDKEYSIKILNGQKTWPAIKIISKLVRARVTDRVLHVATSNYDCLAEYAFTEANIQYTTGFVGGICQHLDWNQAENSMRAKSKSVHGRKVFLNTQLERHIRLYKVHGSLNTFKINNHIVENNSWMYDAPKEVKRFMITPGNSKYERILVDGSDFMDTYNEAIRKHNAFLFIGFGFNDNQLINSTICNKLCEQKNPGVIITKDLNKRIEKHLQDCENLWIVCKHQDGKNEGTKIYNKKYNNWLYLSDKNLWDVEDFASEILGG